MYFYRVSIENSNNIFRDKSKASILKYAEETLCANTLIPEIKRIFTSKLINVKGDTANYIRKNTKQHPVHYIISCDNSYRQQKIIEILLGLLYKHDSYVVSGRYACQEIRRFHSIYQSHSFRFKDEYNEILLYKTYYDTAKYNSCITRNSSVKNFAVVTVLTKMFNEKNKNKFNRDDEFKIIHDVCKTVSKFKHNVLSILCLPKVSENIKNAIYENSNNIHYVEITDDLFDYKKAKTYLSNIAKETKITDDNELYAHLTKNKQYLPDELDKIHQKWFDNYLKNNIYTKYKDIETTKVESKKVKCNSYKKLQELIGLKQVKKVIDKALAFYKVQKLQNNKNKNLPNMHMVFKGNPGSAKKTVARLFADIMKENGVLEKGHLVEVGRKAVFYSDLEEKYYGDFESFIKNAFERAKGGVLLINEIYSLVGCNHPLAKYHGMEIWNQDISKMVQEMENRRDECIIIFAASFPDRMDEFLQSYPELRSRITFNIKFEYDVDELINITKLILKNEGYKLKKGVVGIIKSIYEKAVRYDHFDHSTSSYHFNISVIYDKKIPFYNSSRFIRKIIEKATLNQAIRTKRLQNAQDSDFKTLIPVDFAINNVYDIL